MARIFITGTADGLGQMAARLMVGDGNALNMHHTVRAFERAGVAGLKLEDQVWPERCGARDHTG
jgi:isocitrate lyase